MSPKRKTGGCRWWMVRELAELLLGKSSAAPTSEASGDAPPAAPSLTQARWKQRQHVNRWQYTKLSLAVTHKVRGQQHLEGDNLSGQQQAGEGLCPNPKHVPTDHPSVGQSFRGKDHLFGQAGEQPLHALTVCQREDEDKTWLWSKTTDEGGKSTSWGIHQHHERKKNVKLCVINA